MTSDRLGSVGSASAVRRAADRVTAIPARTRHASRVLRVTLEVETRNALRARIAAPSSLAVDDDSSTRNPLVNPLDTSSMWD